MTQMLCATCDVGFGIRADQLFHCHPTECFYDPEDFPGCEYSIKDLKVAHVQ